MTERAAKQQQKQVAVSLFHATFGSASTKRSMRLWPFDFVPPKKRPYERPFVLATDKYQATDA